MTLAAQCVRTNEAELFPDNLGCHSCCPRFSHDAQNLRLGWPTCGSRWHKLKLDSLSRFETVETLRQAGPVAKDFSVLADAVEMDVGRDKSKCPVAVPPGASCVMHFLLQMLFAPLSARW